MNTKNVDLHVPAGPLSPPRTLPPQARQPASTDTFQGAALPREHRSDAETPAHPDVPEDQREHAGEGQTSVARIRHAMQACGIYMGEDEPMLVRLARLARARALSVIVPCVREIDLWGARDDEEEEDIEPPHKVTGARRLDGRRR